MAGLPSVWTYVRAVSFSPVAWVIVCVGLVRALWLISEGKRVPDYWLLFALTVWLPLFALGFFGWYVEVRYTEFALLALLVSAFAVIQDWIQTVSPNLTRGKVAPIGLVAVVSTTALIVNPLGLAHVVNAGYSIHPDHKGAAEFMKSIRLRPNDIIVAEDSLEQTYYLGHIDYWLIGEETARQYIERKDGAVRDIYTGAPLIGTAAELGALLNRRDRGTVYVIGSGELQEDGRRFVRGAGIDDTLHQPIFELIFLGRDGLTRIWKVRAPSRPVNGGARSTITH